jgi:hypothetical protein
MVNGIDDEMMSPESKMNMVLVEAHNRMSKFAMREGDVAVYLDQCVYDEENGQVGWEVPGVAVVLAKLCWDYPGPGNIQLLDVQSAGGVEVDQKVWVKNCEKLIKERGLLRIGNVIDDVDLFATAFAMSK